jgi:hypothetical protein
MKMKKWKIALPALAIALFAAWHFGRSGLSSITV